MKLTIFELILCGLAGSAGGYRRPLHVQQAVITGQQIKRAMRYTPTRQDRIRNVVEDLGELLKNNPMPPLMV